MPAKSIARQTAIANGEIHYFTGVQCARGHLSKRTVKDGACTTCSNEKSKIWRKRKIVSDPDFRKRLAAYAAKDRSKNQDACRERAKKFAARQSVLYWLEKKAAAHGLSLDQYFSLCHESQMKCWICGKHGTHRGKTHLCIDHCHTTKRVRGLLCQTCNKSLGAFKEDATLLRRAADYVESRIDWRTYGKEPGLKDQGNEAGQSTQDAGR